MVSLFMVLVGLIVSLMSLSVLGVWVGVELNFLGVVCYLSGISVEESESVMKYFIVQVLGSCFMVLGFLMMVNFCFSSLVNGCVVVGICVKLGVFPFHFWVAPVMSGLSWYGCFVVSVIQKFVPLWVICNFSLDMQELSILEILACMTCLVGCLGGLGVLNYRVLLAYSSLVHLGFLIILCCLNVSVFWFYMMFYSVINFCLMMSFWKLSVYCFSDLMKEGGGFVVRLLWSTMYFLSLAGLPPFSGCVMKVFFIMSCWNYAMVGCVVCVLSSVVSLYFYLTLVINFLVFWGTSTFTPVGMGLGDLSGESMMSVLVNLAFGLVVFLLVGLY